MLPQTARWENYNRKEEKEEEEGEGDGAMQGGREKTEIKTQKRETA